MKKYILLGLCLMMSACIGAGDNTPVVPKGDGHFPQLTGIDLQGHERALPAAFDGDLNLVAIGFERKHQTPIDSWMPAIEALQAEHNGVKFYEVPVIYQTNAIWRSWINNGMRSGIDDEAARARTITVYTDRDAFTSLMDMDKTTSYLLLLNKNAEIIWRAKGTATDDTIADLQTTLAKLQNQ